MKTVFTLIVKDFRLFRSDRVAVGLTFVVPILLIALWGAIFGRNDGGPKNLRLAFLNSGDTPVARSIERVLDTTSTFRLIKSYTNDQGDKVPFDTLSIKEYVRRGSASAALIIPASAPNNSEVGIKLKFYYDPRNEMEMQIVRGVLTQTIMTQMPSMFMKGLQRRAVEFLGHDSGNSFNNSIAGIVSKYFHVDLNRVFPSLNDTDSNFFSNTSVQRDALKGILDIESEQLVGKEVTNPGATRSVGGWAMMFLLFSLTAASASLFEEKQSGVVLRILASPISRVQILWGKYLFNMLMGIIQLIVLFGAGALLFDIDIISNFFNLILVVIAASFACTAFGMLLAAVSRTEAQARGLGTFLILTMSSIGGAWFPISFMPDAIQFFSRGTLVFWSMDGFMQVLWRGAPTNEILLNVFVLLGMGALITALSAWQFKRGHVF